MRKLLRWLANHLPYVKGHMASYRALAKRVAELEGDVAELRRILEEHNLRTQSPEHGCGGMSPAPDDIVYIDDVYRRDRFIAEYFPKGGSYLEIGPGVNPLLRKDTHDVYYADVKTTEAVQEMFSRGGYDNAISIDYIINGTYSESVGRRLFNSVFSSHVVEHTEDIIRHFQEINDILHDDGHYVLFLPDMRSNIDVHRDVTPFRDAYDVYRFGKDTKHLVFDYFLNVATWIPKDDSGWELLEGVSFTDIALDSSRIERAEREIELSLIESPDMRHLWVFTFPSFLALVRDCLRLNLLDYTIEYADSTMLGGFEFCVVMKKNKRIKSDTAFRHKEIEKITNMIENPKGQKELNEFFAKKNIYIYMAHPLQQDI